MLNIKPGDLVLEIGSGNRPRGRSDILCDKYTEDNYERAGGQALVVDKRPFVIADGLALPFKDKSFNYVITSHILELVEDPVRFIRELTRVARSGYIENPHGAGGEVVRVALPQMDSPHPERHYYHASRIRGFPLRRPFPQNVSGRPPFCGIRGLAFR